MQTKKRALLVTLRNFKTDLNLDLNQFNDTNNFRV